MFHDTIFYKIMYRYYHDTVAPRCHSLAEHFPRLYLSLVTAVALMGYLLLASFPILLIISAGNIYHIIAGKAALFTLAHSLWLALLLLSTLVSFRIFTFRFPAIDGVRMRRERSPGLFKLLDSLQAENHHPEPDRVMVTDRFELQILKTPEFGIPLWTSTTLVIGLPFLQSLSASHFRCALSRKLAQFNGQDNTVTNWLYQLRDIWKLYLKTLRGKRQFGDQPLYWFFSLYTPLYRSISVSAAQLDELRADQQALDTINNDDLFKTIESIIIGKIFLSRHYWPSIRHMMKQDPKAGILPYAKLEQVIQSSLSQHNLGQWLEQHYNTERQPHSATPSLKARMDLLGRSRIKVPGSPQQSAALVYLDTVYQDVVQRIDEKWLKRQRRRDKLRSSRMVKTKVSPPLLGHLLKPDSYTETDSVFT